MLKAKILIGRNFCRDLSLWESADKRDQRGAEGIFGERFFVLKKTILKKLVSKTIRLPQRQISNFTESIRILLQCVLNIFGHFGNFKPDIMKQFVVILNFQSIKVALIKGLF